jgi:hypothetical protein
MRLTGPSGCALLSLFFDPWYGSSPARLIAVTILSFLALLEVRDPFLRIHTDIRTGPKSP